MDILLATMSDGNYITQMVLRNMNVCKKEKIEHFAVIPFSSGNWQTENLNVEGI